MELRGSSLPIVGGGVAQEVYERRYYNGNYEEDHLAPTWWGPGVTRKIHYIAGGDGICAMYIQTQIGEGEIKDSIYYVYKDYLGSFLTFTDEKGDVKYEQNFDAWGRYRNIKDWSYVNTYNSKPSELPRWLYRGFTGHEHLNREQLEFNLINMNGRLYDPINGRMLSVDNYANDAQGTQGYNRYTYANNNPLRYTDPDGEWVQYAVGAALGGYQGYQLGKASGAKGWELVGCTLFGAGIGALTAGLSTAISASTIPFANTLAIAASSGFSSLAMNVAFDTPLSISLGVASYSEDTGWGWLGKSGNSFVENLGYFWGLSSNVQDLATLNNSIIADVRARKEIAGHSEAQISPEDFISVGPKDKSPVPWKANSNNDLLWESQYINHSVDGNNQLFINQSKDSYWLDQVKVNKDAFCSVTDNINSGKNVFGFGKFKYAVNRGCVNYTSRGLFMSGVPNVNAFLPLSHPALLNFELRIRLVSSYNLTNGTYKKR